MGTKTANFAMVNTFNARIQLSPQGPEMIVFRKNFPKRGHRWFTAFWSQIKWITSQQRLLSSVIFPMKYQLLLLVIKKFSRFFTKSKDAEVWLECPEEIGCRSVILCEVYNLLLTLEFNIALAVCCHELEGLAWATHNSRLSQGAFSPLMDSRLIDWP